MNRKVLITHERFLPDFGGGGENIVFETARGLQRHGLHVSVITTGDPSITEYEGVPTQRLPVSRFRFNLECASISRAARDADLIHTFNYHACLPSLVAGWRTRKPVVCTMLGLFGSAWRQMRGPISGRAYEAWERLLVRRRFARTLFLSDFSRQQAIAWGAPEQTCRTNCPGVSRRDVGAPIQKDGSVLFAGKFEARKGVDDVLAVARAIPGVPFRMAGWGPEEERLRAVAPPNVEFLGFLEGEPLQRAFDRASVFLFPSRAETFGLVIAEAMAAGCAVISTIPLDYEGLRAGDVASMVRGVAHFTADPAAAHLAGQNNRARARKYTWENYTSTLLMTYGEVLGSPAILQEAGACP